MRRQHDKLVIQITNRLINTRYFDICKKFVQGYGVSPKNVEDLLEIDILCQKKRIVYIFEVKTGKSYNLKQLFARRDGLNFNKDFIINKLKELNDFDYIRLFVITPKQIIKEITNNGDSKTICTLNEFLQNPSIIQ